MGGGAGGGKSGKARPILESAQRPQGKGLVEEPEDGGFLWGWGRGPPGRPRKWRLLPGPPGPGRLERPAGGGSSGRARPPAPRRVAPSGRRTRLRGSSPTAWGQHPGSARRGGSRPRQPPPPAPPPSSPARPPRPQPEGVGEGERAGGPRAPRAPEPRGKNQPSSAAGELGTVGRRRRAGGADAGSQTPGPPPDPVPS